jgi:shikimate dehydrogenase
MAYNQVITQKKDCIMQYFGLIGYPLGHSFSKKYFSVKFEKEKIEAKYDLFELANIQYFNDLIKKNKLAGLNVTIPYKEQIIPYLNELDDTAAKIGAVNVIKISQVAGEVYLKGYNSDAIGFENSIKPFLKVHHTHALILGTGGASKAIKYVLNKLGIVTTFVSRTPKADMLTYSQLDEKLLGENTIIVNASPIGTYPHITECPDIPYQFINDKHLLFDVVYNPSETLFLRIGRERGAQGLNGENMLIQQAEAAWAIWNQ